MTYDDHDALSELWLATGGLHDWLLDQMEAVVAETVDDDAPLVLVLDIRDAFEQVKLNARARTAFLDAASTSRL